MTKDIIVFIAVHVATVPLFVGAGLLLLAAFRIEKPTIPLSIEQIYDYLERRDRK